MSIISSSGFMSNGSMESEDDVLNKLETSLGQLRDSFVEGLHISPELGLNVEGEKLLHFSSGQSHFAIRTREVVEIVKADGTIVEVPAPPPFCTGAFAYHQEIFSVISLSALFSISSEKEEWLLVLRPLDLRLCLSVERLEGLVTVGDGLNETFRLDSTAVMVIEVDAMVSRLGIEGV